MGRKGHVLALNAVAKGVAAAEGWATVDMSQVTGCAANLAQISHAVGKWAKEKEQ